MLRSLILAGGFDLYPEGEARVKVDCPHVSEICSRPAGPLASKRKKIFDLLVEIATLQLNHSGAADNISNKLSCMFLLLADQSPFPLAHQVKFLRDPICLHAKGTSDHAPSLWQF